MPWTVARSTPLSMEFSRQESWSGLPFPSQNSAILKKNPVRAAGKFCITVSFGENAKADGNNQFSFHFLSPDDDMI